MINFPDSPVPNDLFTDPNGQRWEYNGDMWYRLIGTLDEAPTDGKSYGRASGAWVEIIEPATPPEGYLLIKEVMFPYDPPSAQLGVNSFALLLGSDIIYTPKSATSLIQYQYAFADSSVGGLDMTVLVKLQVDGVDVVLSDQQVTREAYNTLSQGFEQYNHLITSWGTDTRTIQIAQSATPEVKYHATHGGALKRAVLIIKELEPIT